MEAAEQISLWDGVKEYKPGETTEDENCVGPEIPWSELLALWIGRQVWYKHVLQSFTYYEIVVPENYLIQQIPYYKNGERKMSDRVICYHGHAQRLLIDNWRSWCDKDGPRFFEVKK